MTNYLSKNLNTLFLNCALAFISIANAQEVRVIDNKGTIKKINKVTTSATVPADNVIGDVWFDSSAPSKVSKIYNGTVWLNIDEDKVTTGVTAPTIKNIGAIWFDTSATPNILKVWDGSSWVFVDINETITTFSQETATPTGVITYINEAGASLTANTVSADTNNKIMAGSDGGAYLNGPEIIAAGKVKPDGTAFNIFGATVARVLNAPAGLYQVTFDSPLNDKHYIIQLTMRAALTTTIHDDPDLSYYDQETTGFKVETGDNDNGTDPRNKQDYEFMFTVIDF